MSCDFDSFLGWAEARFGDVLVAGKEVKINSIFTNDSKHHLWCCPEKGVYHCWKTDQKGSLTKLVVSVDNCSYAEAAEMIGAKSGGDSISSLHQKFLELQEKLSKPPEQASKMVLPPSTYKISALSPDNRFRQIAEAYLKNRHLPLSNLMVCIDGKFKDRIVIPYYDGNDNLIYWNSRDLTGKAKLRYRGPKKDEVLVGKEDVLWFSNWPKPKQKIYLTEGEFDAMSLNLTGLNAGACGGKSVSEKQLEMLKHNQIAIAFDADKSGGEALHKLGSICESNPNDVKVSYIRPPKNFKDWNEMLVDAGPRVMAAYIQQNEKAFKGAWTANGLIFNSR